MYYFLIALLVVIQKDEYGEPLVHGHLGLQLAAMFCFVGFAVQMWKGARDGRGR
jgi:hypothetical protein